ncbi:hypothetical protein ABIA33_001405 [Streptacidiphilus sp. MAP12-16]|uniref:hypothetical protein n=1 Tax=Streptacidiphilus sp. MAP12-16 TaxID=3156300 RepID=UPI0035168D3C
MNGYAAVYEIATHRHWHLGGSSSSVESIGKVHAAETQSDGRAPGPLTLCGLDTADLRAVPLDNPTDLYPTWYPPGDHVHTVCQRCNRLATAH